MPFSFLIVLRLGGVRWREVGVAILRHTILCCMILKWQFRKMYVYETFAGNQIHIFTCIQCIWNNTIVCKRLQIDCLDNILNNNTIYENRSGSNDSSSQCDGWWYHQILFRHTFIWIYSVACLLELNNVRRHSPCMVTGHSIVQLEVIDGYALVDYRIDVCMYVYLDVMLCGTMDQTHMPACRIYIVNRNAFEWKIKIQN